MAPQSTQAWERRREGGRGGSATPLGGGRRASERARARDLARRGGGGRETPPPGGRPAAFAMAPALPTARPVPWHGHRGRAGGQGAGPGQPRPAARRGDASPVCAARLRLLVAAVPLLPAAAAAWTRLPCWTRPPGNPAGCAGLRGRPWWGVPGGCQGRWRERRAERAPRKKKKWGLLPDLALSVFHFFGVLTKEAPGTPHASNQVPSACSARPIPPDNTKVCVF